MNRKKIDIRDCAGDIIRAMDGSLSRPGAGGDALEPVAKGKENLLIHHHSNHRQRHRDAAYISLAHHLPPSILRGTDTESNIENSFSNFCIVFTAIFVIFAAAYGYAGVSPAAVASETPAYPFKAVE